MTDNETRFYRIALNLLLEQRFIRLVNRCRTETQLDRARRLLEWAAWQKRVLHHRNYLNVKAAMFEKLGEIYLCPTT